ncbi:beta/gamma crystallin domain-containing protein [Streptomyces goshikiensis]|uniref:beta/gamma crystallin domain-containing protein n=1 Tax=Streptomyces goshikiensis TaxID=1942 RepID=UPI0036CEA274
MVVFYDQTNYQGTGYPYGYTDGPVEIPQSQNDKFKSVKIGSRAKVLGWQHYGFGGQYQEWTESQPAINIGGLSVFQVIPRNSELILARFKHAVSGRHFSLTVTTAGYDPAIARHVLVENDNAYQPIAVAFEDGRQVTTALDVRDESSFLYGPTGSAYFRYNSSTGRIDLDPGLNFPAGMCVTQDNPQHFTFTLVEPPARRYNPNSRESC